MRPEAVRRSAAAPRRLLAVFVLFGAVVAGCAAAQGPPGAERSAEDADLAVTPAGHPSASSTGVPPGTKLGTYRGPCTITQDGATIDSKVLSCDLRVRAAGVTVVNSRINGRVMLDTDQPGSREWSYTLRDSEVDAGVVQHAAVSYGNMTVLRSEIRGGATSVQCGENSVFCVVRDSLLHGQRIPPDADWHLGGFLSNGGTNIELTHNTVVCDAAPTKADGGCTGDINLFGDFAPISHVVIDGNFLRANVGSSYCTYAGDTEGKRYPRATHVVYRNNVFERGDNRQCAAYGPVSGFNRAGSGNKWANNRWVDGVPVRPAN